MGYTTAGVTCLCFFVYLKFGYFDDGGDLVKVNGEKVSLSLNTSLLELLVNMGFDPGKVAVELNEEIVPRSRYGEVFLKEDDSLEVVRFVGGG